MTVCPRRLLLVLASGMAVTLAACGGSSTSSESSAAEASAAPAGSFVVSGYGGDFLELKKKCVLPAMPDQTIAAKAVFDTSDTDARKTKMRAQVGGKGTVDVAELDGSEFQEMTDAGVFGELDKSKIPNWDNIKSGLVNPNYAPSIFSANGLVYNPSAVTPAPDSYSVLWDPQYKGKIGVYADNPQQFLYAAAAEVVGGDPGRDWDRGWNRLLELSDSVRFYGSQEQLGQALQSGEVVLSVSYKARAWQWNKAGGQPLAFAVPKEGAYSIVFGAGIPKNAPNPDSAYAFLNATLEPEAQQCLAEGSGYVPTVEDAPLSDELRSSIGFSEEEEQLIHPMDVKYVSEKDPEWRKRWDREFVLGD